MIESMESCHSVHDAMGSVASFIAGWPNADSGTEWIAAKPDTKRM